MPGLGTFTVNFTKPVPFGPGVDIFGGANTAVPPFTVLGVDQHMRTPYVQSYNFNIQQTLVEGTVLQVGYVGSKGTKLYRVRDINQATAGPQTGVQQRRPFNSLYPQFAGIYQLEASANANYNALQTVLRRRFSNGLTLFASHVWSHSIDDASNGICSCTAGVSLPQNSFDTRAEKSSVRFRSAATIHYELRLRSGYPPAGAAELAEAVDPRLAGERHLHAGERFADHPILERRGAQRQRRIE